MFARCRAVYLLVAVLLFASAGQAGEGRLVQRVYAVSDLVLTADNESESTTSDEQLIKLITETILPRSWSGKGGRGTIDYHPLTMALVVNQTPDVQDQIVDLLAALRHLQEMEVSVEVKFVEVPEELFQDLTCKGLLGKPHKKKHAPDNVTFLDDTGVFRFMEAVQRDPNSNVMQVPKLTMRNGRTAAINPCDEQHFVTGLEIVSRDGHLEYIPKTETIPLGVRIRTRSVVSADRRSVRVHLNANLTNLASSDVPRLPPLIMPAPKGESGTVTYDIEQPQVIKVGVDRTMTIPDGNTAVLTGLSKKREVRTECAVPVLSAIPVLGRMFRTIGYGCQTHQVLVLVTPRIHVRQEAAEKQARKEDAAVLEAIHRCGDEEAVNDFRFEEAVLEAAIQRCGGEGTDNDFRTPILPPYREHDPHCSQAPEETRILRALPPLTRLPGVYEESRDNVQIVTERIVDKIDPPRFFPLVGPARLHHCEWKCSVYYQETITGRYPFCFRWTQPRMDVVYVDIDHLHLVAKEEAPAK